MSDTSTYAIITPTHKKKLSETESCRIKITIRSNQNIKHIFVLPQSQNTEFFRSNFPTSEILFFEDRFFENITQYNNLLLAPLFYEKFLHFRKILICQTDAFIFRELNKNFLDSFHYLGASWNPSFIISEFFNTIFVNRKSILLRNNHELESGNGGLSLRDPKVIHKILKDSSKSKFFNKIINNNRKINEDLMVVFLLKKNGIPPVPKVIADRYFIETTKPGEYNFQNILGFHGLEKHNPELEKLLIGKVRLN